jgi:hypothetical protein
MLQMFIKITTFMHFDMFTECLTFLFVILSRKFEAETLYTYFIYFGSLDKLNSKILF